MTRLRTLVDRHRAASLLAGLALLAALFPAGPFGARVRLAGLLRPIALLQPKAPAGGAAGEAASRAEVLGLRARVHELEAENASLKEFRGIHLEEKVRGAKAVLATILGRDSAWPERRSMLLDQGTDAGLRRGMPVVAGGSLAGFLVEVGPSYSRVQLLDDPAPRADDARVRVGVRVFRPGVPRAEEGVLYGEGRGVLRVRMLHAGAVKAGDIVVTSASDASVPAGLVVGSVASVEEDRRLQLATAKVDPSADLAALRTLVVLVLPEVLPEHAPRTAAGKAR